MTVRQLLAKNYKKIKNIKMVIIFAIMGVSYYYKFYYDLVVVLGFMLFLIELKKWRI